MEIFGASLQIVTAIILVLLLCAFGFLMYNMEAVNNAVASAKVKKQISIFSGIADLRSESSYNTTVKMDPTFRDISPSVNQPSGAEMTYNFWMYKEGSLFSEPVIGNDIQFTDAGLRPDDFVLFVHGDKKAYDYKNVCGVEKNDIKIKCPLVKLERGGDVLTVEFNTISSQDAVKEQARNACREFSTDWLFMNAHKIAIRGFRNPENDKKWNMVSIILQDTSPNDPLPIRNKIRCRIYVNGVLQLDRYVDSGIGLASGQSLLRRNNSYFHVAPRVTITPYRYSAPGSSSVTRDANTTTKVINTENSLMMADLTYFNYALGSDDVKALYAKGFTKDMAAKLNTNIMTSSIKDASIVEPGTSKAYQSL